MKDANTLPVLLTITIQLLLWRDKKREARAANLRNLEEEEGEEEEVVSESSTSPVLNGTDLDGKKIARTISREVSL